MCAEEHERFHHPPAPAQDYVQGALLPMTEDQGAVLLCVQRNMNAFITPPAPAQDYVQGALLPMTEDQGAVLLCVQRNMNAFITPPPLPKTMFRVHMGR